VVTSEFEIIIALSPTYRFEEWVDYEPWRHYNGQVKLTVNSLSIEVLEPAVPEHILEPISSSVISSNDGCFFSRGLTTTEDGSVYGLANLYPRSSYYISDDHGQVLLKINPITGEYSTDVWYGNRSVIGMGIAANSSDIFTVGITRDINTTSCKAYIAKWDDIGQQEWISSWGDYHDVLSMDLIITSDSAIYVFGIFYISIGELIFDMSSELYKFSAEGQLVWKRPIAQWNLNWWHGINLDTCISGTSDTIYVLEPSRLSAWNFDGFQLWNISRSSAIEYFQGILIGSLGQVFTVSNNGTHYIVSEWIEFNGSIERTILTLEFGDGWTETLKCQAATITKHDSIIGIIETYKYDSTQYIVQTEFESAIHSISRLCAEEPVKSLLPCSVVATDTDLLYVLKSEANETHIYLVFQVYPISSESDFVFTILSVSLGLGVLVLLPTALWLRRKRSQFTLPIHT
ncbi:MAG: hypothetical protein KAJ36_02890, partial [Candidatus Thorarchaeota archaeon]|nr:hypothetical protein [Candidatus Thorarchaeota archaeon]